MYRAHAVSTYLFSVRNSVTDTECVSTRGSLEDIVLLKTAGSSDHKTVCAQNWYCEFRKLVLMYVFYNIKHAVKQ